MSNKINSPKPKVNKKNKLVKRKTRVKSKNRQKKVTKPIILKIIKYGALLSIWGLIALAGILGYFAYDLPDVSQLGIIEKQRKVTIIDRDDEVLTNYGDLYGEYLTFDKLPINLIHALLATEDRRFFTHHGVDPLGLIRAFYTNFRAGHVVQGGSTITQQLAKIAFLTPQRTLKRKIQELMIALYLEQKLTKEQILCAYLNRVYMGSGIYGVGAAARYYFGKNIEEINLKEAAIIIGLLKAPTTYSPVLNSEKSGQRAYQVLVNMHDAGYISEKDIEIISAEPVFLHTQAMGTLKNSYFSSWILDQVNILIPDDGTNLIAKTTINPQLQMIAKSTVKKFLNKYGENKKVSQAALIAMSNTGEVLAMIGGTDYLKSPFNRAVQAQRQPGSVFKHIVYTTAFENGVTPNDIRFDGPITIKNWQPRNSSRKFYGDVTIREAFARSLNTVAVQISEQAGRGNVINLARDMGITSELIPHPSIALGSVEVNLLELTGSYAVIANGGYSVNPYGIYDIKNEDGGIIYKRSYIPRKIISDQSIKHLDDVLSATVSHGSGFRAQIKGHKVAGKTGTSQDNRDGWFVGYVDNLVIGVWMGNDDNSPTNKLGGSNIPALLWKSFAEQALKFY